MFMVGQFTINGKSPVTYWQRGFLNNTYVRIVISTYHHKYIPLYLTPIALCVVEQQQQQQQFLVIMIIEL